MQRFLNFRQENTAYWDKLGYPVTAADTEVWQQVWTPNERVNNASTPMFLVRAEKLYGHKERCAI